MMMMKRERYETHMGFVDETVSISLIGFGLKCPPPNAHPLLLKSLSLFLSVSLVNYGNV